MNTIFKTALFVSALSFSSHNMFAQTSASDDSNKKEDKVIIIKKGGDEKYNIVIDGDNVTINGKPADDFESENLKIIKAPNDNVTMALPPMPPGSMGRTERLREYLNEIPGNKAFLGVMSEGTKDGAKITDVTKDSPAEKGGLKEGDVITKLDNESIGGPDDLYKAVGQHKEGDKVIVTYKRDDKEYSTPVTLTKNKEMRVYGFNGNKNFNFDVMPPSVPNAPYFFNWNKKHRLGVQAQDTEDGKGVKVLDVEEDSPAETAGLKENDIIMEVNGKAVVSAEELRESIKDVKDGDTVQLKVNRNGQSQTMIVKFPKDLKTMDL